MIVGALAAVDVRGFSPSEPINWDKKERTSTGFRDSGIVLGYELDCTTGQVRAETPLFGFNVLTVDEGFVATHKPDEACARYGWDPEF